MGVFGVLCRCKTSKQQWLPGRVRRTLQVQGQQAAVAAFRVLAGAGPSAVVRYSFVQVHGRVLHERASQSIVGVCLR